MKLSLTSFPWNQALLKSECSDIFQNGPFPPPAGSPGRFFSRIYCGNLVEDLGENLTIVVTSLQLAPLEFVALRTCPHWCAHSLLVQFRLSYPALVPAVLSTLESPLWDAVILYLPVCLTDLGCRGLPMSSLSDGPKTSYWCFSLFSFILVNTSWWLPSSLRVESREEVIMLLNWKSVRKKE